VEQFQLLVLDVCSSGGINVFPQKFLKTKKKSKDVFKEGEQNGHIKWDHHYVQYNMTEDTIMDIDIYIYIGELGSIYR